MKAKSKFNKDGSSTTIFNFNRGRNYKDDLRIFNTLMANRAAFPDVEVKTLDDGSVSVTAYARHLAMIGLFSRHTPEMTADGEISIRFNKENTPENTGDMAMVNAFFKFGDLIPNIRLKRDGSDLILTGTVEALHALDRKSLEWRIWHPGSLLERQALEG